MQFQFCLNITISLCVNQIVYKDGPVSRHRPTTYMMFYVMHIVESQTNE